MVERKQQVGESFDDYYTDMHNLSFRLQKKKLSERELVDIIKGNLKGPLANMLFPLTIFTLVDLKRECHRAEKVLRDNKLKVRPVNEISTAGSPPDQDVSTSYSSLAIEAINSTPYRPNESRSGNRNNQNTPVRKDFGSGPNTPQNAGQSQLNKQNLCPSPFHMNLCFVCGMPGDFYRKNPSVANDKKCSCIFHEMKCFLCRTTDSYCFYEPPNLNKSNSNTPNQTLNRNLAEVTGGPSQMREESPEE